MGNMGIFPSKIWEEYGRFRRFPGKKYGKYGMFSYFSIFFQVFLHREVISKKKKRSKFHVNAMPCETDQDDTETEKFAE